MPPRVLLTAASASLRRGLGAVVGVAWPVAIFLPSVARVHTTSPVASAILSVFRALNYLNPIGYMRNLFLTGATMPTMADGFAILMLALLTAVYVALAVAQWQRVEA